MFFLTESSDSETEAESSGQSRVEPEEEEKVSIPQSDITNPVFLFSGFSAEVG